MTLAAHDTKPSADPHERLLDRLVDEARRDPELVALAVFGSVAAGRHRPDSDLDLLAVLVDHPEPWGIDKLERDGIEVDRVRFTARYLAQASAATPWLLHPFLGARVVHDPTGAVTPLIAGLRDWFAANPEVVEVWERHAANRQEDRRTGVCRTTLLDAVAELGRRFGGEAP